MSAYSSETQADQILKVGFETGGNLLNKMWIPSENISEKVDHHLKTDFKGFYMIGLQIRSQFFYNLELGVKVFKDCAIEIEGNLSVNRTVKWFLSSDSESVISKLEKDYPGKVVTSKGFGQIGHSDGGFSFYPRAILDQELLSKCDEMILTGGSTFGFVAAMKRLKFPYYVNGGNLGSTRCVRMSLGRPSLFFDGLSAVFK
jgi:hypothetical protein